MAQNGEIVHVNPSALRFWDKIGLGPLHGAKNVTAVALFEPDDDCDPLIIQTWLQDAAHAYEVSRPNCDDCPKLKVHATWRYGG